MPARSGSTAPAWSEAPLVLGLLLVPLVVWPGFLDAFTSVKWCALGAVAAAWLLSERLLCGGRSIPSFARRHWAAALALAVWVVAGSLRQGPAWALSPLVARASFVAAAAASYWYATRSALRLTVLPRTAALAAAVEVALGLLQMAGLPWPPGLRSDAGSATFGNVNMASQFVGLALVVAVAPARGSGEALAWRVAREVLVLAGLAYVALAGTRSVALALVAACLVLAVARPSRAAFARLGVSLLVTAAVSVGPLAHRGGEPPEAAAASKAASARWRLAVWSDTLDLVRDHPLGVGAGNFEHAFMRYALSGRSRPGERLVFRSPHNDYLRLVAEEGVPGAMLALALLLFLVRELNRSPAIAGWRSDVGTLLASCAAFLAVEAFFQFPFEMAPTVFVAAVLLGLALAAVDALEVPAPAHRSTAWAANAVVIPLAAVAFLGMLRLAAAERLSATRRQDAAALERSCALDPRRVEACVQAAWLRSRAGDHAAARRLLDDVLAHSPAYFPAIKLLAEDLLSTGDREAGCRSVRAYAALLGEGISVPPRGGESCAGDGSTR